MMQFALIKRACENLFCIILLSLRLCSAACKQSGLSGQTESLH